MIRSVLPFAIVALLAVSVSSAVAQTQPAAAASSTARPGAKPAVSGPININTATAAELQSLPGIGAKTAARIVEYRQKNGPFKKVEELMNVRGVGEKNFLKLKPQITAAPAKAEHGGQQ